MRLQVIALLACMCLGFCLTTPAPASPASPVVAFDTNSGTVDSITYDVTTGYAISFILHLGDDSHLTFTFQTPSAQMTSNLQGWKESQANISVYDADSDRNLETGDTITE
jgi:hypothetical protein